MSVSAEMWKQIVAGGDAAPARKLPTPAAAARLGSLVNPTAFSLVHQLFFPTATLRRTSVLFAAVDAHSKAATLCEQVAIALSQVSGEMVGIVEASSALERNPWIKGGSRPGSAADSGRPIPPGWRKESGEFLRLYLVMNAVEKEIRHATVSKNCVVLSDISCSQRPLMKARYQPFAVCVRRLCWW